MHVEHNIEARWYNNCSCLEKEINSTYYECVKVSQAFNSNPQGSRVRGQSKNR